MATNLSFASAAARQLINDDTLIIRMIEQLNQGYVDAFLNSDVEWYTKMLGWDFKCVTAAGTWLNREEFLKLVAEPRGLASFSLENVVVRIVGDTAVVHGRTTYKLDSGLEGVNLYTDIWARRHGQWQAIFAQMTPARTGGSA